MFLWPLETRAWSSPSHRGQFSPAFLNEGCISPYCRYLLFICLEHQPPPDTQTQFFLKTVSLLTVNMETPFIRSPSLPTWPKVSQLYSFLRFLTKRPKWKWGLIPSSKDTQRNEALEVWGTVFPATWKKPAILKGKTCAQREAEKKAEERVWQHLNQRDLISYYTLAFPTNELVTGLIINA